MELNIGSNIIRNTSGVLNVSGKEQISLEIGKDDQLLLTMDLYDRLVRTLRSCVATRGYSTTAIASRSQRAQRISHCQTLSPALSWSVLASLTKLTLRYRRVGSLHTRGTYWRFPQRSGALPEALPCPAMSLIAVVAQLRSPSRPIAQQTAARECAKKEKQAIVSGLATTHSFVSRHLKKVENNRDA